MRTFVAVDLPDRVLRGRVVHRPTLAVDIDGVLPGDVEDAESFAELIDPRGAVVPVDGEGFTRRGEADPGDPDAASLPFDQGAVDGLLDRHLPILPTTDIDGLRPRLDGAPLPVLPAEFGDPVVVGVGDEHAPLADPLWVVLFLDHVGVATLDVAVVTRDEPVPAFATRRIGRAVVLVDHLDDALAALDDHELVRVADADEIPVLADPVHVVQVQPVLRSGVVGRSVAIGGVPLPGHVAGLIDGHHPFRDHVDHEHLAVGQHLDVVDLRVVGPRDRERPLPRRLRGSCPDVVDPKARARGVLLDERRQDPAVGQRRHVEVRPGFLALPLQGPITRGGPITGDEYGASLSPGERTLEPDQGRALVVLAPVVRNVPVYGVLVDAGARRLCRRPARAHE